MVCFACVLDARKRDKDKGAELAAITVDYPVKNSIFPPDFHPPTFQWRDPVESASSWWIDIEFADGSPAKRVKAAGERMKVGRIDERCTGYVPPTLTPNEAAAHVWKPEPELWSEIKRHSVGRPATITITGIGAGAEQPLSRGRVALTTSKDPVGAPIFYRDVPLIPFPTEKGIIKPLPTEAVPLIAWRLRFVGDSEGKVMMEGLPTCANCHSFSRDGKTLGLDVDGPQNDKGLYALVPVQKQMAIRNEDVIKWSSFQVEPSTKRFGFMSQVSPDGQYVITTIENPGKHVRGLDDRFYNAGYKDYGFGQVFYPTKGILAWYSKATKKLEPLPGADDPALVQSNATWSPDGKWIVFVRATAREPYPAGAKDSEYANDPNETQIQYDLYRIPFNEGRGGVPERIEGASENGKSNNFAKVSPDINWIVYVRCKNGLLMRPDSELYIVPFKGGTARRLDCNLPRMNSWHSWSPNGRWLVFSSKGRSLYTEMFLTHIDENGQDSPAIRIENATAANRAVNIPEFVNIPPGGMEKIDTPATEFYRLFDLALSLARKGDYAAAIPEWRKALEYNPEDPKAYNNLGSALARQRNADEAIEQFRKALELEPGFGEAHVNLGVALAEKGKLDEALLHFARAAELTPDNPKAHGNLGGVLIQKGRLEEGIASCRKALEFDPAYTEVHNNLAIALMRTGKLDEAVPHLKKALEADPNSIGLHFNLGRALAMSARYGEAIPHLEKAGASGEPGILGALASIYAQTGRFADALGTARKALRTATERNDPSLIGLLQGNIDMYQKALQSAGGPAPASQP